MMIPKGWRIKALEEIAEVRTGLAVGKTDLKDPVRLPYLRVANVQAGRLDLRELKYINVERKQIERYSLQVGDVLMTEGGDFDKLGRGDVWMGAIQPCLHQNHVFAVRPNTNVVLPHFLAAMAGSAHGKNYFLSCAKKSTNLASINSTQLKQFPVHLPSIEEQRNISRVLATWDEAIALGEKLLSNSNAQKRALMQKLLVAQDRIPKFIKPWQQYRLGKLFSERVETGKLSLPLLSITREEGVILRSDVGRKDTSNEDKSKYLRICSGDIGYNTMRMWQGVSALSSLEGLVSPAYTVIIPSAKIDSKFAAYLLKDDRIVHDFYRHSQGLVSDTWNLKYRHFAAIKVTIPDIPEQKHIARVLAQADAVTGAIRRQLDALKRERSVLTDLLLTGKRRLKFDAPVMAAA